MSDIFLSYARKDRERAEALARALEACGWVVFWDRQTPAGMTWDSFIGSELEAARCVLVCWSSASVKSEYVREEADEGRKRHVLVPVLLESVKAPLFFRRVQAVDLSAWDGKTTSRDFQSLVAALSRLLGSPPEDALERNHQLTGSGAPPQRPGAATSTASQERETASPLSLVWGDPPEGEKLAIRWINRGQRPVANVSTNAVDLRYWHDGQFHWDSKPKEAYWSGSRTVNPSLLEDQPDQVAVVHRCDSFELKQYRSPSDEVSRTIPGLWAVTVRVEAENASLTTVLFFSWDAKRSPPLKVEADPRPPELALSESPTETAPRAAPHLQGGETRREVQVTGKTLKLRGPRRQAIYWRADQMTDGGLNVLFWTDDWPETICFGVGLPVAATSAVAFAADGSEIRPKLYNGNRFVYLRTSVHGYEPGQTLRLEIHGQGLVAANASWASDPPN